MRYSSFTRNAEVLESFNRMCTMINESRTNDGILSSAINYIISNNIDQTDAKTIVQKNVSGFVESGGDFEYAKQLSSKLGKLISSVPSAYFKHFVEKPKNSIIVLVLTAMALAATGQYENTEQITKHSIQVVNNVSTEIRDIEQHTPDVTTVAPSKHKTYQVKLGDTLWDIAKNNAPRNIEVTNYIKLLRRLNQSTELMKPGDELILPSAAEIGEYAIADSTLTFDVHSDQIINDMISNEGDKEYQSNVSRKTSRGKHEPSYQRGKFLPYLDINGNWTIGYGHFIGKDKKDIGKYKYGITDQQAVSLLKQDLMTTYKQYDLVLRRNHVTDLPENIQIALFEMSFNLGPTKFERNFKDVLKHIKNKDYTAAADVIKNSAWAAQIGDRANGIVNKIIF